MSTLAVPPAEPVPAAPPVGAPGVVLRGVSWERYEAIWKAYEGRRGVRLNYDRGALEIMTISPRHGKLSRRLYRLIVALCEELRLPLLSGGEATLRGADQERGLEPDETFWLANEAAVRGRDEVDLSRDPPPDLCLEVEVTRSALDRLDIYAGLRVPEVWHGNADGIEFLRLTPEGAYAAVTSSPQLPHVTGAVLAEFLRRFGEEPEQAWVDSFRAWVRQQAEAADRREP